jgi:formylmethanofuran dehydrogenase subunit E
MHSVFTKESQGHTSLVKVFSYTFEEYVERVRTFHGFAAPGVVVGGFMIELAYQHLSEEGALRAVCETPKYLPDAIQILTAKTIGNGQLTVINGETAKRVFRQDLDRKSESQIY